MATTTVHLTANRLRALLTPVIPLADKGDTMPVLNAVLLRSTNKHLTATATDRYRLGIQRVPIDDAPKKPLRAVLGLRDAKSILAIFKPTRTHDPLLSLTFTGDKVTVATADGMAAGLEGSLTWALERGEYPYVDSLVIDAFKDDGTSSDAVINPTFLADFRHATAFAGEPLVVRVRQHKPWAIRVGYDFIGVQMPIRGGAATFNFAAALDGWVLDTEPKKEKVA